MFSCPKEKKKSHGTKDMAGPYRFLIVDSVGYIASWTKSSKPKASFGQGLLYSAVYLVDYQFPGSFLSLP